MSKKYCYEATSDHKNEWLQIATDKDTLILPGIDSCLGMVFIMEDDSMVGGHASVFPAPPLADYMMNKCTEYIINEMLKKVEASKIARLVLITDIPQKGGSNPDEFYFDIGLPEREVKKKRGLKALIVTKIAKAGQNVTAEFSGPSKCLKILLTQDKSSLFQCPFKMLKHSDVTRIQDVIHDYI